MNILAWVLRIAAFALLAAFLVFPQRFAPLFAPLTEYGAPPIYDQGSLLALALAQLGTVFLAAAASTMLAVALAIFVTRRSGAEFLPLSRTLVNFGQTFPPVAVLAIAVPLVGFGLTPTLIALFAYGLLPIFENTLSGLQSCPPSVLEAADGMGMSATPAPLGRGAAAGAAADPRGDSIINRNQCRHRDLRLHGCRQGSRRSHYCRLIVEQYGVHPARRSRHRTHGHATV